MEKKHFGELSNLLTGIKGETIGKPGDQGSVYPPPPPPWEGLKESKRRHDGILSKRRKTTFKCVFCNVYLCIGGPEENCFFDYHTKLQYWL